MSGFVVNGGGGGDEMDMERALANPGLFSAQLAAMDEERLRATLIELPKPIQKRIKALKKLQVGALELEAEFYRKVHELEAQYQGRFSLLNNKRRDIATGAVEPSDQEADYPLIGGLGSLEKELAEKAKLEEEAKPEDGAAVPKGIPDFWLHTFKNVEIIADMIQEYDEPILKELRDVELTFGEVDKELTFTINFHFNPNAFFSNTTLSKTYRMKCAVDPNDPFDFDGPEIVVSTGTKIEWSSKETNVTVKMVKKKQKHKAKATTRFVTKEVKADSFFNFFEPPPHDADTDLEEMDDDTRDLLNADFEIGQVLRDRVIPRAVLYFTGEAQDDDDEYEDEDEDASDADDDEDDDDDDEEDAAPPPSHGHGKGKAK